MGRWRQRPTGQAPTTNAMTAHGNVPFPPPRPPASRAPHQLDRRERQLARHLSLHPADRTGCHRPNAVRLRWQGTGSGEWTFTDCVNHDRSAHASAPRRPSQCLRQMDGSASERPGPGSSSGISARSWQAASRAIDQRVIVIRAPCPVWYIPGGHPLWRWAPRRGSGSGSRPRRMLTILSLAGGRGPPWPCSR
jgi:hypothetical protein